MPIQATNNVVLVIKGEQQKKQGEFIIPEKAQKSTHRGKIISVGELVSDKSIKKGRSAIFNKSAGWELEEDSVRYLVLTQIDIVATDE